MNKTVSVIGAGTMGRGIAQVFAQSGYEAFLYDVSPAAVESAVGQIHKMLGRAVEKGRMSAEDAEASKKRLHTVSSLSERSGRSTSSATCPPPRAGSNRPEATTPA